MARLSDYLSVYILRRPRLLQVLTGLAQRLSPVLSAGSATVVTRSDDIREVLNRHTDFEYDPFNRKRMLLGEFLLALNPYDINQAEKERLGGIVTQLCAQPDPDTPSAIEAVIESICASTMVRLNDALDERGEFDLVKAYAEPVVVTLVEQFFGIPVPQTFRSEVFAAEKQSLLAQWLRKVGSVIATLTPAPFGLQRVAEAGAAELKRHIDEAVKARWSESPPARPATVLDGLLQLVRADRVACGTNAGTELTADEREFVSRNLGGMVLAGSTPLIKSFTHAIAQLLERPDQPVAGHPHTLPPDCPRPPLACAINAAAADRRDELECLLFEALRFNPTFPVLSRYCPRDTGISQGSDRAAWIPAGHAVIVPPIAAMFDRRRVRQPDVFGYDRPDDNYMHFGWGGHRCLGESIARPVLVTMALHFLRWPELSVLKTRPAARVSIRYDGPAVDSFTIRL